MKNVEEGISIWNKHLDICQFHIDARLAVKSQKATYIGEG